MPDFEVEVLNTGEPELPNGAFEARLIFSPRRARFTGVRLREPLRVRLATPEGGAAGEPDWSAPSSVLLWVAWSEPLRRGERLRLVVSYEGEPPMAPRIELSGRSISQEVDERLRMSPTGLGDAQLVRREILEERARDVAHDTSKELRRFSLRRYECIDSVKDETKRAQMFFFLEFDEATHSSYLRGRGHRELAELIDNSSKTLVDRAIWRLSPDQAIPVLDAAVAEHLSGIQLPIIRQRFGTNGQLDLVSFREAFVAFASAQLAPECRENDHWNGKPNSAYFFLFAEFAIHAYELGVEPATWMALLPTFIECQDLYANVFKPFCVDPPPIKPVDEERRTFGMYKESGAIRAPVDLSQVLQDMATRYTGIETATFEQLVALHTENAKRFFPLGRTGSNDPCAALVDDLDVNLQEDTMASKDGLKTFLRALTDYVRAASAGQGPSFDESDKWFVVNPSSPPRDSLMYATYDAAEAARNSRGDSQEHTIGALTVILDMNSGDGWDGTPTISVHVVAGEDTTVVGTRDNKPYWWRFPNDKFTTFVVVVPKDASA